jgi:hypothetical protein
VHRRKRTQAVTPKTRHELSEDRHEGQCREPKMGGVELAKALLGFEWDGGTDAQQLRRLSGDVVGTSPLARLGASFAAHLPGDTTE